jgi:hypothetical protein
MEAETTFRTFADDLRDPGQPVIAPDRFASAMHLRQGFMRDTLRVLSAAMGVAGDRDRAIYWYRNTPIPEFEHLTAEHLVSTGKTDAVVLYLRSIESGSTG